MKRTCLVIAAITAAATFATGALAQGDPIAQRQQLMKQVGDQMKIVGPMMQGKVAYDGAAAGAAMAVISKNSADFITLFPEDSKTGGDTEALPVIWERKAEFDAIGEKLSTEAAAAAEGAGGGLDAFKPLFAAAAANCKACHEDFRKP
ncbi:c-type cytochrome [Methylobrevis albus]|uniref:Cytochrome c n=1 Tax=Methylobrevis albus TaxID=2793297 RepID=A0A931I5A6_9HYPH|nr:cytochrome c [Methylobrevis albus]MBH0239834.1 cytochrome c [Methylobrevis albus]